MLFFKKSGIVLSLLFFVGCGSETTTSINPISEDSYAQKFINSSACDVILDKLYFTVCYDNQLKAAKAVAYSLDGDLVNELNIIDRPYFYEEEMLDIGSRANYYDYSNSGYDRGHLAPDASFDWSQESLEATYSLANIIPQVPEVNQLMWVDAEFYERSKAVELGEVNVINIVKYGTDPIRIGENQIAVSDGYYKVLYKDDYMECFYYENDPNASSIGDYLDLHRVSCSSVSY